MSNIQWGHREPIVLYFIIIRHGEIRHNNGRKYIIINILFNVIILFSIVVCTPIVS